MSVFLTNFLSDLTGHFYLMKWLMSGVLAQLVAALPFPDIHLGLYDCDREEQI